jgi:hypothetical protein
MQFNLKVRCMLCGQEIDIESTEVTLNDFILDIEPFCSNCSVPSEPSITIPVPQALD